MDELKAMRKELDNGGLTELDPQLLHTLQDAIGALQHRVESFEFDPTLGKTLPGGAIFDLFDASGLTREMRDSLEEIVEVTSGLENGSPPCPILDHDSPLFNSILYSPFFCPSLIVAPTRPRSRRWSQLPLPGPPCGSS